MVCFCFFVGISSAFAASDIDNEAITFDNEMTINNENIIGELNADYHNTVEKIKMFKIATMLLENYFLVRMILHQKIIPQELMKILLMTLAN